MERPPFSLVVVEASPLISCLKIDRFDLLETFGSPLTCVNHVRSEVSAFGQVARLDAIIASGRIGEAVLDDLQLLDDFNKLRERRSALGAGECASIVYAVAQTAPLVIADRTAMAEAKRSGVDCISMVDVIVHNITSGRLTLVQADELLPLWASVNEGIMRATSFAEHLPK